MAVTTVTIMIENTTHDVAKFPVVDSGVAGAGYVVQPGVLQPPVAGSSDVTTNFYARTTASDIAGYRKLLTANANTSTEYSGSCTPPPTDACSFAIEEFATDAGAMDGITMTAETVTVRYRAKKSAGVDPSHVTVELYHRTSGGVETLITSTDSADLGTSYANYTWSPTITKSWGTNERLVVKFIGVVVSFV